jgi:hypothetical protein
MTDSPPDRLSNNPASPHFDADALRRGVGVRFKGVEKTNVEEYCATENWIRVQAGKTMNRRGEPLTIKLTGPVEIWFREDAAAPIEGDRE